MGSGARPGTIRKYVHDLAALLDYLDGAPITKAALIGWKEELSAAHAPATVNSMLSAANSFLRFMGCQELAVKPVRIQKSPFRDERRELSRDEYIRLVQAARAEVSNKGKWRTVFLPGGLCRPRQPCRVKPAR